jgi:hypothetical protein
MVSEDSKKLIKEIFLDLFGDIFRKPYKTIETSVEVTPAENRERENLFKLYKLLAREELINLNYYLSGIKFFMGLVILLFALTITLLRIDSGHKLNALQVGLMLIALCSIIGVLTVEMTYKRFLIARTARTKVEEKLDFNELEKGLVEYNMLSGYHLAIDLMFAAFFILAFILWRSI